MRSSNRLRGIFTLSLFAFIFSLNIVLVAGQTNAGSPKLVIDSVEHDFGQVVSGEPLSYSFRVRNTGNADLLIKSVTPSCGCTNSEFDKIIHPGAEGKIELSIPVTDFIQGKLNKFATVVTNDPSNETFKLTLMAELKKRTVGGFSIDPSEKWSVFVKKGATTTGTITMETTQDHPLHVTKVDPGGKTVEATLQTVTDGHQYKIALETNKSLKVGSYKQTAIVYTDNERFPEISLYLEVNVTGDLAISPTSVRLVDLDDTSKTELPVITVSNTNGDLKIKHVSSNLPFLKLEVSAAEPNKAFNIRLSLNKDAVEKMKLKRQQDFSGYILIETNDKDTPLIQLPVTGMFKNSSSN